MQTVEWWLPGAGKEEDGAVLVQGHKVSIMQDRKY